jgi:hypothetical protein
MNVCAKKCLTVIPASDYPSFGVIFLPVIPASTSCHSERSEESAFSFPGLINVQSAINGRWKSMGLWGVLLEVLKTAATHAAPHMAKGAVDIARERMASGNPQPQGPNPIEELSQVLTDFDKRIAVANQRAVEAEAQIVAMQQELAKKAESARIWVIALLSWNALVTLVVIYLLFRRR